MGHRVRDVKHIRDMHACGRIPNLSYGCAIIVLSSVVDFLCVMCASLSFFVVVSDTSNLITRVSGKLLSYFFVVVVSSKGFSDKLPPF
jgi:hypothetical protein